MELKQFHDPEQGPLAVAGFMSGSGTNLRKILEHERKLEEQRGKPAYRVRVIFTDSYNSNAFTIGRDFNIPVILRDINAYYEARNLPKKDMSIRAEFDRETVSALSPYNIEVAVYAGYMSIASEVLVNAYRGVNVHPADLSQEINGKRKWVGAHAVLDALLAGEKYLKSTTHMVEKAVDGGRLLMLSPPLKVLYGEDPKTFSPEKLEEFTCHYQDRLKKEGDWQIFPKTLEFMADGRFSFDKSNNLYFDGEPIPRGVQL
ncbi:MAG: hypothetical protein JW969_18720 [Spirochaetales bacterium]|nr:hypothetical protein [Spirochaetales bacterium]